MVTRYSDGEDFNSKSSQIHDNIKHASTVFVDQNEHKPHSKINTHEIFVDSTYLDFMLNTLEKQRFSENDSLKATIGTTQSHLNRKF